MYFGTAIRVKSGLNGALTVFTAVVSEIVACLVSRYKYAYSS